MNELTGRAFLVISSMLIPLFFLMGRVAFAPSYTDLEVRGGLGLLETAISLFIFVAFPLSAWLLWHVKKPIWMKFALALNGLFFALELVACTSALLAWRSGVMFD